MKSSHCHRIIFFLVFCLAQQAIRAQKPADILKGLGNRIPGIGNQPGTNTGQTGGSDSLKTRNRYEDSITVTIYYLDSTRGHTPDSSINDFTTRYPIPATHIYLGNTGVATRSIVFAPRMKAGFNPGFHALDVYKWQLEKARFYNTTRPYSELSYMLGSRAEQIIEVLHTQNIKPYWNFSFNYRLINAPGVFRNQKTNHNNYLFTSWYQAQSKRYNNYFVLLGNRLQAGENGGLQRVSELDTIIYAKDRFLIPTRLGGDPSYGTDFFSTTMFTGNRYREFNLLLRQQYDLGKKDSLVSDSTVIQLFYPRLRFEHTFTYGTYKYSYIDLPVNDGSQSNLPDSLYYASNYNIQLPSGDSLRLRDSWREVSNDFSIYQFPDAKNLHQFIKLGAQLQLLRGSFSNTFSAGSRSLTNIIGHAEYRNRTRNQKWDMQASGQLYLAGYNLGDYRAYVSLQRVLGPRLGTLKIGFENVNRKPPFIYDQSSGFYLETAPKTFSKENIAHFFAALDMAKTGIQLSGDYYLLTNYLYLTNYYQLQQEGTLFNVLRVSAMKTLKFGKHWNLAAEVYIQQKTGSAQLHLPALYTRNRFMYEGNLGFPNLAIAMGLEARYHTPYKADAYSPVLGQFYYQNSVTISNLPDVSGFVHFRIRSFKAYFRLENLNTARLFGGFQFNNNNLAAPNYPTPGLLMRLGIYWGFVN